MQTDQAADDHQANEERQNVPCLDRRAQRLRPGRMDPACMDGIGRNEQEDKRFESHRPPPCRPLGWESSLDMRVRRTGYPSRVGLPEDSRTLCDNRRGPLLSRGVVGTSAIGQNRTPIG